MFIISASIFVIKLGARLDIPVSHRLKKNNENEPQSNFQNLDNKRLNVKDNFYYENKAELENKNILLVDDTYDSGATIKEIGKYLSSCNVTRVMPFFIARTFR